MSLAYYNEIDPFAAQWLRNLISAGHIAPGEVDERDIRNVRPDEVDGYTQCHWFAGIGGWSFALRLARWPDSRSVWTGSCPCQPFSAAGKGQAANDERHLWPAWFPLISECSPPVVFGEQVEAAIGWGWLDVVFADLEDEGYAIGASVLPACSVGAPHIRQRLWWVGHTDRSGRTPCDSLAFGTEARSEQPASPGSCGRLAHADGGDTSAEGLQRGGEHRQQPEDGSAGQLGDTYDEGSQGRIIHTERTREQLTRASGVAGRLADTLHAGRSEGRAITRGGSSAGRRWSDAEWLPCRDGKSRPVEPGTFPLAHGIPGRVGRLRAYGNAIVPQVAAEFISAFLNSEHTIQEPTRFGDHGSSPPLENVSTALNNG